MNHKLGDTLLKGTGKGVGNNIVDSVRVPYLLLTRQPYIPYFEYNNEVEAEVGKDIVNLLSYNTIFLSSDTLRKVIQNRVSTGRTTPKNLREQLFMQEVKSNPQGTILDTKFKMSDSKNDLYHSDGWRKKSISKEEMEIHYLENIYNKKIIDFKFKDKK